MASNLALPPGPSSAKKTSYAVPAALLVGGGVFAYLMLRPKKSSATSQVIEDMAQKISEAS